MTTRIPIPLYDLLMAETEREGISQNEVVVRALRSALEVGNGQSGSNATAHDDRVTGRTSPSAQTQVLDESSACPDCGGDIVDSEDGRICSDCHARIS